MAAQLTVSSSPHIRGNTTTTTIMRDVLIALVPAVIAAIVFFGPRALLQIVVSVAACMLFEHLYCLLTKQPTTIRDLSAAVTGVLLACNLPVSLPLWMTVIGALVAIVVVKMLFGGIGCNFANPALTARIVLMLSFTTAMTTWVKPMSWLTGAVTGATPLGGAHAYIWEAAVGYTAGCLGETSALALLLGGIYLCWRKVISPVLPVCFIGTVFVFTFLIGEGSVFNAGLMDALQGSVLQILSGGLFIGAIFMATDYTTSVTTTKGRIIYGVACGLITSLIRVFGSYPEGVSFSILLLNLLAPYIEQGSRNTPFGAIKAKKVKKVKEGEAK